MTKKLQILNSSLKKKEEKLNKKFQQYFADVKMANGQPLNDKRNGLATLNRWERQEVVLRNLQKDIEKTKIEKFKVYSCEDVKGKLPQELRTLLDEGKITQWRKFPNRFFVVGVERARLVWDEEKKIVIHQYVNEIPYKTGQFEVFKEVFNYLNKTVNRK